VAVAFDTEKQKANDMQREVIEFLEPGHRLAEFQSNEVRAPV
jgi:hypothetical protein